MAMSTLTMNSQKYLQKSTCTHPLSLEECPKLKVALPQKGDYHICYYEETDMGFLALFRITYTTKEEIRIWKTQFQESSLATWRVARTHPQKQKTTEFRIDYRCQHKTRHIEDKYISKNTNCDASMVMRVVKQLISPAAASFGEQRKSTEPNVEREREHARFPTIVSLVFEHNHSISTASALRFRDVPKELEEKFYNLFMRGYSVRQALEYHTEAIKSVTPEADWKYALVDRAKVPDKSWCYKIFTKVRKLNPEMKKRKHMTMMKRRNSNPVKADAATVRMEQIQHLHNSQHQQTPSYRQMLSPPEELEQIEPAVDIVRPQEDLPLPTFTLPDGEHTNEEKFDFVVYEKAPKHKPTKSMGMLTLAELSVSAACSNYSPLQRKMLDTYAVGEEEHSKDKLYLTLHRTRRGKVEKVRRSCRNQQYNSHRVVVSVLYEGDREGNLYNYQVKNGGGTEEEEDELELNEEEKRLIESVKPMTVNITVDNFTESVQVEAAEKPEVSVMETGEPEVENSLTVTERPEVQASLTAAEEPEQASLRVKAEADASATEPEVNISPMTTEPEVPTSLRAKAEPEADISLTAVRPEADTPLMVAETEVETSPKEIAAAESESSENRQPEVVVKETRGNSGELQMTC